MNVFQKRAQDRDQNKFSNSMPKSQDVDLPIQDVLVEEEIEQPKQNVFQAMAAKNNQKKEEKFGFWETAKDTLQQIGKGAVAGIGGAYGNILDAFGLQAPEEQEILPGQKEIYRIQNDILDKMNRREQPTFSELMLLSDDDLVPNYTRLLNSKQIKKEIENITGIGEGKTPLGRVAGHGTEFLAEGIPLGGAGKALSVMGGSGAAGQVIRELGGPEWLASTLEIAPNLLHGAVTSKLASTTKAAKETVKAGRHVGLSEKQIAPLIQGERKTAVLSKVARKGTRTKKLFDSIKESLRDSYNNIKASPQAKVHLPNAEQIGLRKEFGNIRNELSKTLAPSPDKQAALDYIEKSLESLRNANVTPEYLINFWQDINKSVKWNSINGGKKALAALKEPISNTLKKVSPQLAEDFEMTNHLYSKYVQISKKLKPDLVDSFVNKGEIVAALPAGLALVQGNPTSLIALGGEVATRLLAREMLINPYFQNLANKLVTNFNAGSAKGITELVKQAKDYMNRKHPEQDWSFLTQPNLEDEED